MKPFVAIDGVLDYLFFIIFRCISVEKCAQTENLYWSFKAVPGPVARTASNDQYAISVWAQSAFKMHTQVAAGALIFFKSSVSLTLLILLVCKNLLVDS